VIGVQSRQLGKTRAASRVVAFISGTPYVHVATRNASNISETFIDEYYQGHYDEAEKAFREVLQLRRDVSGNENRDTLGAIGNLSAAYQMQGRYAEAEPLQRELLETRRRIFGPEHDDTVESMALLANTLTSEHKAADAEKFHREAYEIQKRKLGPDHPEQSWR
jgi:tetratricopeptide (TPR) repeat protein